MEGIAMISKAKGVPFLCRRPFCCIQVDLVHEVDITINILSPHRVPTKYEEKIPQSISSQMIFAKYSLK
jgi:hypothetical protein